jgi:hypothetical protein
MGFTQHLIQWVPEALSLEVKLTTHFQLVPRSRYCGYIYIHSPIRLQGIVLNYLSTGTTLPYHVQSIDDILCLVRSTLERVSVACTSVLSTGSNKLKSIKYAVHCHVRFQDVEYQYDFDWKN